MKLKNATPITLNEYYGTLDDFEKLKSEHLKFMWLLYLMYSWKLILINDLTPASTWHCGRAANAGQAVVRQMPYGTTDCNFEKYNIFFIN